MELREKSAGGTKQYRDRGFEEYTRLSLDQSILLWINQGWGTPCLDSFFYWISMRGGFSFPLLGFVLVLLARWFGKDGIKAWLVLLFAVGVGDALGGFIKDLTDQHRPCYDFYAALRMPQGASWPCGASTTGMPSNHALNFFTAALFLLWLVPRRILGMVMLVVAVLVALSRIYLGKHYPSQVLVGALLGGIWGMVIAWSGARLLPSLHRMRQAEK